MPPVANTILTRYGDEVGRNAEVTIQTGTDPEDDNYGPAQLVTDNPAKVAKILSTTGAWQGDQVDPTLVRLVSLIHHDFDAGANVRFQMNSSTVWTAPTVDVAVTIPAWRGSGTRRWPINPWIDLAALYSDEDLTQRYWRLIVTSNSQNLQLGAIKLYSDFTRLASDFREGLSRSHSKQAIVKRTAFDIATIDSRGTNKWAQEGALRVPSSEEEWHIDHFFDSDGSALPFLIVPNGLRNSAYFVRRQGNDYRETVFFHDLDLDEEWCDIPLALEEVGRGLRPGV